MKAEVINMDSDEINLSIKEADIGILYIIQHEVLKAAKTKFAGVIVKHPLTHEYWIKVNSSEAPLGEIQKATELALTESKSLVDLFHATIKV